MSGRATDGRALRRHRNRDAAVDALITLFERGAQQPTIDEVAAEAQVSSRSIYRYFADRHALVEAAVATVLQRAAPHLEFDGLGRGPFETRVVTFVDHRLALYRSFGQLALVASQAAANDPAMAEQFELGHLVLRRQFVDHFDPELGSLSPPDRTRATTMATLAFQFESFRFLIRSLDDDLDAVRDVLVDGLLLSLGRFRNDRPLSTSV